MLPLLLLAACTHDDAPASPAGIPLPPDTYPLQIASVTISADGQPQTRLADEGNTTKWQDNDQIMVSLGDKQAVYTYTNTNTWHSDTPLYWENTTQQEVNAWYPVNETIDFTQQSTKGLTYLLKADPVTADQPSVNLTFTHQLAKVRVVLSGTQAGQVETVAVHGYTSCTHNQGSISTEGAQQDWITMHPVDATTYEANVVPGTIDLSNFIQINGQTAKINDGFPTTLDAAKMYTIDLTVGDPVVEDGATLDKAGTYTMQGTYNQGITISGEGITVVLNNVTLDTSDIGIDVQSDATIHVSGADNTITSGSAGIYVAEGKTVTITGSNRDDKLTTCGGNGAGIGGYVNDSNSGADCGNIIIRNVTVASYGRYNDSDQSAGIGGASRGTCGTITIENAAVHAYGTEYVDWAATPAIGSGYPPTGFPTGGIPVVTISGDSEVHAHRGGTIGNTDYIGWGGHYMFPTGASNAVNLGGGKCTDSTIYCYTGDSETPDKTVKYDASGIGTEITP